MNKASDISSSYSFQQFSLWPQVCYFIFSGPGALDGGVSLRRYELERGVKILDLYLQPPLVSNKQAIVIYFFLFCD